jgi:hypothetical protein
MHSPPPELRHEQHDVMHLTESVVASSTTSSSILDSSNPTPRAWSVREGSPLTDDDHHEVHQLSIRQEGYRLDSTSSINTDSNSSRVSHITLSDSCNSTSGTSGGGHSDRQRPSSFSSMLFNHQLGSSANSVQSPMAQQPMSTSVSSIICPPPPIKLVNNASLSLGITEEATRLRGGSGECLVVIVLLPIPGPPLLSPRSAHLFFHFPRVYLYILSSSLLFFFIFFGGFGAMLYHISTHAPVPPPLAAFDRPIFLVTEWLEQAFLGAEVTISFFIGLSGYPRFFSHHITSTAGNRNYRFYSVELVRRHASMAPHFSAFFTFLFSFGMGHRVWSYVFSIWPSDVIGGRMV